MALQTGQQLQDFTLKMATQDGVQEFTLSQHLGKGPLVIGFFPFAFSAPCTKEMCDLRDSLDKFGGLGATVLGFSTDSHFVNAQFVKDQALGMGILSDPNREVVGKIWQTMEIAGVKDVAKRGVMIVEADGTVKWTSVSDDPKVWVGADEVRKHL